MGRRALGLFETRLEELASKGDAQVALVFDDREVSCAELLRRTRTCAAWLAGHGLVAGETVGVTVADDLAHIVVTFALLILGVPQICLPTLDPVGKRLSVGERLGVRRVVADRANGALPRLAMLSLEPDHYAAGGADLERSLSLDPNAPAVYYASSGATGEPKLFALSQRWLYWRAQRIAESERASPGHRSLTFVSLEDSMAKSRLLSSILMGAACVIPEAGSLLSAPEICARHRVTCLELSIFQVSSLAMDPSAPRRLPPHTTAYTAGAAVSPSLRRQFAARFETPLYVHYGAREFGRISSTYPQGDRGDPESVGAPGSWLDFEIVDGDGNPVPRGAIGEIRVRSEQMIHEYYRDPVATARHFRHGWFYPKDLACLTAEGDVHLYGRADDMMNLNGIKIFPAEIERVLEGHPAVKTAAAFSKRSTTHGDIPLAAVELHASAAVSAEELLARARERLGMRAPRRILVLDELPRNASGKVVKRRLIHLLTESK
ncbi:MAG TPA: AMP-binding protein [Casimicrobiaceae bacterium]|nr:AMP-binding protein [Casimicrobiaceae bacterium]